MDFVKLLEPYKTSEDITPQMQIRWLKRLGFSDDVINRTMIAVYTEVEQGVRKFKDWQEFNICLRETAKIAQAKDEEAYIKRLQEFEANLKKKWQSALPWWKKALGLKK